MPKSPEKRQPLAELPPQQQRATTQVAKSAMDDPKDGENTNPGLSVKSAAAENEQVLPISLDPDVITKIQ